MIFYLEIFALLSMPFDLILAVFRTFLPPTAAAAARPTRVFYGSEQRVNESDDGDEKRLVAMSQLWNCVFRAQAQWNSIIFRLFFMLLKASRPGKKMRMRIHFIEFVRTIQL